MFSLLTACSIPLDTMLNKCSILLSHNRLKYEPTTGEYVNNRGVETRIPDFGGTSSIEYLDEDTKFFETTDYFHDMIQWFVDKGYTRGKDIVGAPYDWRYSPSKFS